MFKKTVNLKKAMLLIACGFCLSGCGGNNKEPAAPETFHMEKESIATYEEFVGKKATISSSKVVLATDSNYSCFMRFVKQGDRYNASFRINTSGMIAYAFTDDNDNVISSYNSFTDNYGAKEYYRCSITVPYQATTLYINCDASYFNDFDLRKVTISNVSVKQLEKYNNIDKNKITVACNNIGEFDYGNTSYTTAQYKEHWSTMLKSNDYDFFGFEDLRETYLDNTFTSKLLGAEKTKWLQLRSFGEFFGLSTNYQPISSAIVPLPFSVNGKTSKRFIAVRHVFLINKKLTAIYSVHLVAEGHITTTTTDETGKTINYLSQQLRQNQFQILIKDARAYDEAIITGDFNAQKCSEYQTWVNEGFNIANGSEKFGDHITLVRDPNGPDKDKPSVPADNIITTKGITINTFKLLDTYNLNTDHRPIISELQFGE